MECNSISSIMAHDHRECDNMIENLEKSLSDNKTQEIFIAFESWKNSNLKHFEIEEKILFPETVNSIGAKIPPIMVMEMEHVQIKTLFNEMELAIRNNQIGNLNNLIDTCLTMIQQHNMKEEQILYPIIEKSLASNNNEIVNLIKKELNN